MTKNYLEIPEELYNKLSDYAENDQLSIRLENQQILLENPKINHTNKQNLALHYFIVPSLASGFLHNHLIYYKVLQGFLSNF